MKVLITGASGQLGTAIKDLNNYYKRGLEMIYLNKSELDISDKDSINEVLFNNKPDAVINCAAYTKTSIKTAEEKTLCRKINQVGPGLLAKVCNKIKARLIHVSTDYVFQSYSYPFSIPNPIGYYGKYKFYGELEVIKNNPNSHIVRTSWLFYEGFSNFVTKILERASIDKSITVNNELGRPTYAGDLAKFLISLLSDTIDPTIFHFTGKERLTRVEFVRKIIEIVYGIREDISSIEIPIIETYIEDGIHPLNSELATQYFSFRLPSYLPGLERTVYRWLQDNPNSFESWKQRK